MPSLVVIGQQMKEKRGEGYNVPPPAWIGLTLKEMNNDPSSSNDSNVPFEKSPEL